MKAGKCNKYEESRRKREAAQPKEVKVQPKEETKEERDIRRTMKILREVWM